MNVYRSVTQIPSRDPSKDRSRLSLRTEPSLRRGTQTAPSPSVDQLAHHVSALRLAPMAARAAQTANQAPPSFAQSEALSARPHAAPAIKVKKANGTLFSYLIPQRPQAPVYRISKTFARGGFSKLRVALSETDEAFALMVLHPYGTANTSKRPVQATPFTEMEHVKGLLQYLNSPMQVLEEFVDGKGKVYWRVPLMAMDLHGLALSGPQMSPLFHDDTMTLAARLFLFREMASALIPIHEAELVHFDVKLENFLIDGSDRPRVVAADLGLALPAGAYPAGHPRGTWSYMAPEVAFSGRQEPIDQTSDIFSLGMVVALMFNSTASEQYVGKDDDANRAGRTLCKHVFFDLWHMQEWGFTADRLGDSLSRVTLLETYQELEKADPSIAELVMDLMLSSTPEDRPTAREIVEVIDEKIAPEALAAGQRVVADQIRHLDVVSDQKGPSYFARLLQTVPARPTEEVAS